MQQIKIKCFKNTSRALKASYALKALFRRSKAKAKPEAKQRRFSPLKHSTSVWACFAGDQDQQPDQEPDQDLQQDQDQKPISGCCCCFVFRLYEGEALTRTGTRWCHQHTSEHSLEGCSVCAVSHQRSKAGWTVTRVAPRSHSTQKPSSGLC